MKKVVIFGAAGHTGKYITEKMKSADDIELSVFVRNPEKFSDMDITGVRGLMLNMYAKQRPEYIEAADTIAASKAVTTLLRCPGIKDGDNTKYFLTKEGVQPAHKDIDRAGIAQCMYDLIDDESVGVNDSLGITN